jgi:hypothetical protein
MSVDDLTTRELEAQGEVVLRIRANDYLGRHAVDFQAVFGREAMLT